MDVACVEVTGTIQADAGSHLKSKEIGERYLELFRQESMDQLKSIGTGLQTDVATMALGTGMNAAALLAEHSSSSGGLEALLFAQILGTWTAFETMAGDLWETAINLHPAGLAELKGTKKRLGGREKSKGLIAPIRNSIPTRPSQNKSP
jgi:hypothetical protein